MNEHQKEAMQQAYQILGEHFDSAVIIVHADLGDQSASRVLWKGGYMTALGLVNWALGFMVQDRQSGLE